jgi:hypothetical protein
MRAQPVAAAHNRRRASSRLRRLARRSGVDAELDRCRRSAQNGVIQLIDAAPFRRHRSIKFETFAERRVRGAMTTRCAATPGRAASASASRADAAREAAARAGTEPSMADLPRAWARTAPEPDDRPHQHHRVDIADGDR